MKNVLRFHVAASAVFLLCMATAIASPAQTFTSLVSFDGSNGAYPVYGSLIQGLDGNLYGTTQEGGVNNYGTVFEVTAGGRLTTLDSFDLTDGAYPYAGLVLATNGNFYGTTYEGGANGSGTVFEITPGGTVTTLYSFCSQTNCADGDLPSAAVVQAADGTFFGTTHQGGANGDGTVFQLAPDGTLTTLYSFCAQTNCADGYFPYAGLAQSTNGTLYGTTYYGGANQRGTVFEITTAGTFTTLHSFDGTDGEYPVAGLVLATNGNFFGTTTAAGANGGGTMFEITAGGTLTTLYNFDYFNTDGYDPVAGLVQAANGNFFGATAFGGANTDGTVFEITTGGVLTTLHSFDVADGERPSARLVQATNGNLYGTTLEGGVANLGTAFSLSVGLGPFIETLPSVGKVGSAVIILGNSLSGTTSVTFNGTSATFTVVSPTEIKTTVPTSATSGKVQVTTPHGTLTSNVVFRVK
jgi:uncharacterized repeat protein (TIGR03803 family)